MDALTQLVEQHDGKVIKDEDNSIAQLELDVTRVIKDREKKKKITSRTSSLDSSCPPGSPFQNNPLLVSHDYAKSPLMEDVEITEEEGEVSKVVDGLKVEAAAAAAEPQNQNVDAISNFDPRTRELFEPHRFAPKDLLSLLRTIETDIHKCNDTLRDETEKRKKHKIDDCRYLFTVFIYNYVKFYYFTLLPPRNFRRVHDYDEFITTFLAMLADRGQLGDLLEHGMNLTNTKKKIPSLNTSNGSSNGNSSGHKNKKSNKDLNTSAAGGKPRQKCRGRPKKKK